MPGWNAGPSNSTWQSLSRNTGNVETDFLNGEIVRLAHKHGITAPLNAALDGMGGWGLRSHVNVGCRQGGPGR